MEQKQEKETVDIPIVVKREVADWLAAFGRENYRSMRGQAAAIVVERYNDERTKGPLLPAVVPAAAELLEKPADEASIQ